MLIVLSCVVWGRLLSDKQVLFECDNSSVMSAVIRQGARGSAFIVMLMVVYCLF